MIEMIKVPALYKLASLVKWSLFIIVLGVYIRMASSNQVGYNIKMTTTGVT